MSWPVGGRPHDEVLGEVYDRIEAALARQLWREFIGDPRRERFERRYAKQRANIRRRKRRA